MTIRAEETRNRILNAALTLFREKGFDTTTMRDIASEAGVATGAAYYYFHSKEDLVMAFYLRTAEEMRELLPERMKKTRELKKRLRLLIDLKFEQFETHRSFLGALFRIAVDPVNPLSPFGDETREIREESIDWFRLAIEGSSTRIPKEFAPFLPRLFWLYQMGLILFWIYDRSSGQARTRRLVEGTLEILLRGIALSSLPLMGPIRRSTLQLLRAVDPDIL